MRVLAYLRVSTDEQAEEGFSLPTQQRRILDFCRSQWEEAASLHWYVDEGCSAKDTDRPRLKALRMDAQAGDTVVVLRLDRLTRSVLDLYTLLKEWEERGIFFRSVTEPYDTQKPEGRFMIGLLALLAEWERLRISERVREVMLHTVKAEQRHLSRPPLGYDLADGHLTVNPAEAEVVREIFRLYASGLGARAVALELNRRGQRTRQGARWSDFAVTYVLRNPVYVGKVAWQRIHSRGKRPGGRRGAADAVLVDGHHAPLIEPELWAAVSGRMEARPAARGRSGQHPLTGLLRCGLCGAPVHGVVQRRYRSGREVPGRERRYYRCSRREQFRDCALPYLPADRLESAVLEALPPPAPPDRLQQIAVAHLPGPSDLAARLTADLRRCDRALHRWDEAYAGGDLSRAEWRERTEPIRARRQTLTAELSAAQSGSEQPDPVELAHAMSDLRRVWDALGPAERRALLQAFLRGATVQPDGSVQCHLK